MVRFCPIKSYFKNENPFNDICYLPICVIINNDDYNIMINFLNKNNFKEIIYYPNKEISVIYITTELKRYWLGNSFDFDKILNIKGTISSNNFLKEYPNINFNNEQKNINYNIQYVTEFFKSIVSKNIHIYGN